MWRLGDHCGAHLAEVAASRRDVWVLDGDLADSDGAYLFAQRHPDRFIMAGIAEQSMVSMAAGMASCGLRPWVFSFAAFLCYRAYDQIRIGLSQARQPVTLVGSHSGGCAGRNGKTHAALNDLALMMSLPNMRVWAPADPQDVRLAIHDVLDGNDPAYLRLPRRPTEDLPGSAARWRWIGRPGDVALVSTGLATHFAVAVADKLRRRGLDVGVLHSPFLGHSQARPLADALTPMERVFTIEDHTAAGGLGSLVHSLGLRAPVVVLGWPRDWAGASGSDDDLLEEQGLGIDAIAQRILSA
jgi:transketolase